MQLNATGHTVISFKKQRARQLVGFCKPRLCKQWLCWLSLVVVPLAILPPRAQAEVEAGKCASTFLVVRHAERNGDLDSLTKAGEQRAEVLASLGTALKVDHIYSTDTQRTKGSVQPLAKSSGAEITIYRKPSEEWIGSLKQKHSGQVVLIVGHSNTAGVIAGWLANSDAFEIAHDEYDAFFIIRATESATNCVRLKYGNSSEGASSAAPHKMGELETTRGHD